MKEGELSTCDTCGGVRTLDEISGENIKIIEYHKNDCKTFILSVFKQSVSRE